MLRGEDSAVQSLAFSADGKLLAAIYQNCDAVVWPTGASGRPVRLPSPDGPIQAAPNTVSADVAFVPGQHAMITNCSYADATDGRVSAIFLRDTRTWLGSCSFFSTRCHLLLHNAFSIGKLIVKNGKKIGQWIVQRGKNIAKFVSRNGKMIDESSEDLEDE